MEERDYQFVEHENPYTYRDGDLTVTRGSAWSGPGCHLGCGVLLYTNDEGDLVKVEGDPENPFNEGRLCVRCLDLPEMVNNPKRLTHPLRRAKADRGHDRWERIGWDEALDLIAAELNKVKEAYGPESVIFSCGTGRDIAPYITRLCWSFGSPNFVNIFSGNACYLPRVAGCIATTGAFWVADCAQQFPDRYDNPAWQMPETMFVWGNYPLIANSDGFFGHWVVDLMKRGMKIVMIDPKVTWLSAKAEVHLPVRPGTDAALALAMMNVIINEDLYDHDFVDRWCYGFEELSEHVQPFTPEYAETTTWVPAERIRKAARILAASRPATLQWGVAVDMTKEALPAGQAIMALFQVTGNVEVPGGIIVPPEILNYGGGWGFELLGDEQNERRLGLDKYSLFRLGFQAAHPNTTVEAMKTGRPYPIKAAWVQTSNFLACMSANSTEVAECFRKLDFVAGADLFMTPTIMAFYDVVLPAAMFPERDCVRLGDGAQRAEAINKVCRVGECKSDMEMNLELGRRLAPEAWPWENVEDMFTEMIASSGITFPELREAAPVYLPFEYGKHEKGLLRPDGSPGFYTATGRIELWSTYYKNAGLDPLPVFDEPAPGPLATPELLDEYPLVLCTGARRWPFFHSEHRQAKRLLAMHPDPWIEIHPETCAELGVADGDWVWVENMLGRAKRRVKETPIFDPRIVAADHGWWNPEGDPENLYDIGDLCINNLIAWGNGKSGFGGNYKTNLCKVYKMKEGE